MKRLLLHFASLRLYLGSIFRYAGKRVYVALLLLIILGMIEGVGLILIIPLLHLIGFGESGGFQSRLGSSIADFLAIFQIPLNLTSILCMYLSVIGLYAVLKRYRDITNAEIIYGYMRDQQEKLYETITYSKWRDFIRARSAHVTQVLTTDLQRVTFGTQQLIQFVGAVFVAGVHVFIAFTVSAAITLITLVCGCLLFILLRPYYRRVFCSGQRLHYSMNDMFTVISEHLGGMKIAKSYGLERRHLNNFRSICHNNMTQYLRFIQAVSQTRMLFEIGAALALSVFLYAAVKFLEIKSSDLILMVLVFSRLMPKFSQIQQCVQHILNALPSFNAIVEMRAGFESKKEINPIQTEGGSLPGLEREVIIDRVYFKYNELSCLFNLENINISLPARRMTGIIGPSGSGKSTLTDLLMGLFTPESGDIKADGVSIFGQNLNAWQQMIGYVPQESFLFHDTVRANLLWGRPDADEQSMWDVLGLSAADQFVSRLPEGLDTIVGDRGVRLSGGERQRISLARALLRNPQLLILDEATSSLDRENERQIQAALERLQGVLTLVVVAHRLSSIRNADQIIVLKAGKVEKTITGKVFRARYRESNTRKNQLLEFPMWL